MREVVVVGKGTVGAEVIRQLEALGEVRLVGVVDSARAAFGFAKGHALEALASAPKASVLDLLPKLGKGSVLVDCTADGEAHRWYLAAFARGLHVVAANKKPLVRPWSEAQSLRRAAREVGVAWKYEATVGAGLPVLQPLQTLVRTGDVVHAIDGCLSGTLGFVCQQLQSGVPLSRAVASARELGFTEPHPRDDLSGLDVARKALILARELGLALELEQVSLEPLVPASLASEDDPLRYLERLRELDAWFAARRHEQHGKVLRYVARIRGRTLEVGPRWVGADDPAFALVGPEAMVCLRSRRYATVPMCIRGPGAGAEVTATGVVGDVLSL